MKWIFNPIENWMVNVDQIVHIRKNTRTSLLEVVTIDNYCHHIEGMELDELLSLMRSAKDDFIIIPSASSKEAEENKPKAPQCPCPIETKPSDVKNRGLVDWTVISASVDGFKTGVCNCKRKFTIDEFLTAIANSSDHRSGSIEIVNTIYTVSGVTADRVIVLTFDKTQADSESQAYQISSRAMNCPNNIDLLNTEVLEVKCVGSYFGRYDYTLYIAV